MNGNLLMWMSDPDQEQLMEKLGIAGNLKQDPTAPELGVYVDDDSGAKLSWYLSEDTQVGDAVKNADGTTSYQVTTTYKNNLTEDQAKSLPSYVDNHNGIARESGDMVLFLYLDRAGGRSHHHRQRLIRRCSYSPGVRGGHLTNIPVLYPPGRTTSITLHGDGHGPSEQQILTSACPPAVCSPPFVCHL